MSSVICVLSPFLLVFFKAPSKYQDWQATHKNWKFHNIVWSKKFCNFSSWFFKLHSYIQEQSFYYKIKCIRESLQLWNSQILNLIQESTFKTRPIYIWKSVRHCIVLSQHELKSHIYPSFYTCIDRKLHKKSQNMLFFK